MLSVIQKVSIFCTYIFLILALKLFCIQKVSIQNSFNAIIKKIYVQNELSPYC